MKSHTEYLTFNIPARMDFLNSQRLILSEVQETAKGRHEDDHGDRVFDDCP
jgi:hypothetical protein